MALTRANGEFIDDKLAVVETQAQATVATLKELRDAHRVLNRFDVEAERDDALRANRALQRAKTALERENTELKAKLAALTRDRDEIRFKFDELLLDVRYSVKSATYDRGEGDFPAASGRAIASHVVGKRTSDGPAATSAAVKRSRRYGAGADKEEAVASVALFPASAPAEMAPLSDVARLEAGMDLTMNLVDRFLSELQDDLCAATKSYCRILPASVLSSLMGSGAPPPSPAAYLDILSTEIVVLPLLQEDHWSVTMVFRLDAATTTPATIAFFDTYDSVHRERTIHTQVRNFLAAVQRTSRPRSDAPLNLLEGFAKVPLQREPHDSGVLMLLYVQTALLAYSRARMQRESLGVPSPGINFDALCTWLHRAMGRVPGMVQKKRNAMLATLQCRM
ncbi:hypothetical protein SDRG_12389 [Saprolegnia diclina VS20]|uniref:Ubiquitin-like protease family profile domain-containing protein n=1 Tax=Saprolegnia diclina (strain VS20) TaxID=1156394 RepID=T0RIX8_SAPDV|nr:hypothetical protein SDRG_12389 [Saprolegnia diclina VS20]EQC29842.1 hypothetical protein SDRG_12389 [Saprolegnia diclina VS20]|eukprot:XP_008616681.1 hypothetical protein SDRG_12389 [Saprolegnia diclina VS20]